MIKDTSSINANKSWLQQINPKILYLILFTYELN